MRMTEVLACDDLAGPADQLDVLVAALDGPAERRTGFDEAARLARPCTCLSTLVQPGRLAQAAVVRCWGSA